MTRIVGSKTVGYIAIVHQLTYMYPPLNATLNKTPMPYLVLGNATDVSLAAWAPLFIFSHSLCALCILWGFPFIGFLTAMTASLGFLAIANFQINSEFNDFISDWSLSPHMVQHAILAVALLWDAVHKRQVRVRV